MLDSAFLNDSGSFSNPPVVLTVEMCLMGHQFHPTYSKELTTEIRKNLQILCDKVNHFLHKVGVSSIIVNSGWRPVAYNLKVGGSAKSRHCLGQAVDLADKDNKLKTLVAANIELCRSLDLSMEHASDAPSWCHLQFPPPKSGNIIFRK